MALALSPHSAIAIVECRVELSGTRDPVTLSTGLGPESSSVTWNVSRSVLDILTLSKSCEPRLTAPHPQPYLGVPMTAVTITGGQRVTVSFGGYHVPRHDLLANLRVLLEKTDARPRLLESRWPTLQLTRLTRRQAGPP